MPIFYKNLLWHYQFSHCIEIRSDIVSYSCTYRETKSRQTRGRKIDRMGISRCTRRNDREESGRPPSLASHPFASKDNRRNKAEGDITFTTPVWIDGASMITRYFPSSYFSRRVKRSRKKWLKWFVMWVYVTELILSVWSLILSKYFFFISTEQILWSRIK